VPENVNRATSLSELLEKPEKYTDSHDLTVAVHINRGGKIDCSQIDTFSLPISELYFFGSLTEDQSEWFVRGGKSGQFTSWKFDYPAP
jgi:hypothetical protein